MKAIIVRHFRVLLALLTGALGPSTAWAKDYPADPTTVEGVLREAQDGDHVLLAAGDYKGKQIWVRKAITLEGAGREKTTITGGFHADGSPDVTGIRVDSRGVTIRKLTVKDITNVGNFAYFGILVDVTTPLTDIIIEDVEVTGVRWSGPAWTSGMTGNGIGVKVRAGGSPRSLDRLKISDNYVHDCQLGNGEAISLGGEVTNFAVERNVVDHVDNIGIDAVGGYCWFAGVPARGTIRRNNVRFVDATMNPAYTLATAPGIYIDGGREITVEDNDIAECNIGVSVSSENVGTNARFNRVLNNRIRRPGRFGFNVGGQNTPDGTKGFAFDNVFEGNKVEGSPTEAMVLFGRTRPWVVGSKANDWSRNTFTWEGTRKGKPWWTPPEGDVEIGDIETDTTNVRVEVP